MRRTKIIATIGPVVDSEVNLEQMMEAGVSMWRFNMKHNNLEWHSERMGMVEKICQRTGRRAGILMDLQGPEVRTDQVEDRWRQVKEGEVVRLVRPGEDGISVDHPEVLAEVKPGQKIYIDDGLLEFEAVGSGEGWVEMKAVEGGEVKARKTVNFPGMHLSFPALIDKDLEHLSLAARHGVDWVALSFVRSKEDIVVLRRELKRYKVEAKVIAKIEHPDAVGKFDEILEAADGVMVARGDLGIEYPLEEVPGLQKMLVRRCREAGKPVIIATQMLESMIYNPRPTRAEVSDVANAVYDGADAVMLSAESAAGKYPVRAVKMMARIARKAEETAEYPPLSIDWHRGGQTAAVVGAANSLIEYGYRGVCDLKAVVIMTETGKTVEYIARLRPRLPIIALSKSRKTLDQLELMWGVTPVYFDYAKSHEPDIKAVVRVVREGGWVEAGDKVVMIYGETWGKPGLTSVVRVQEII